MTARHMKRIAQQWYNELPSQRVVNLPLYGWAFHQNHLKNFVQFKNLHNIIGFVVLEQADVISRK